MRTARESAVRLLQLMMIASLVFPAALFVYASWNDRRDVYAAADERINRSLDVQEEQALKVFETVDRTFAEVNEVVRDMSNDQIRAAQARLHPRLKRIVDEMPQLQAIVLVGRDGRPMASSLFDTVPADARLNDRDYFKAQADRDRGTYVGELHTPRLPGAGGEYFDLSRRLASPDGSFDGVIAVAVRPSYFEDFYALIEPAPGNFYALVRADGAYLTRYPVSHGRRHRLSPDSAVRAAIGRGLDHGLFSIKSAIDGIPRRIGFRKLRGYPVYAIAGTDRTAIEASLFSSMEAHLIFGLPATLLLFGVLWVTLQRTRRLHDEAERREIAEGALHQAQQLQAIGQLTGGVAHDFNNLLMIIGGSAQLLRRHLTGDKPIQLLDAINNATRRGESLTRQLLTFSRRQMLQPSVIDLAARLPEIKDMLSRSLRGDIEIRIGIPRRSCFIKADPSELELALLNLAVNARDAMPSGGTLTITIKPVLLRGKASEEGLNGEFIAVRVADTGTGIPADVLPRVFEPYFTTKDVDKGTGLGLSQVYGFAKQSGGAVTITSAPRRGTAVTLFLPRTWETPDEIRPMPPSAAVKRPAGTVLLVEDNAEVAAVGKAYLEQLGYEVRQAASAQAALDLLDSDGDVDAVFSDILMPGGMNGLVMAGLMRRRFPNISVLLTTGYSSSADDAVRQGFEVLQKPYDIATLQRALGDSYRAAKRAARPAAQAVG